MKPRVVVLLGSYLPGYKAGGPIRSVVNLVAALGDRFRFEILTADRDLGDSRPYPSAHPGTWVRIGNANVKYFAPGVRGLMQLIKELHSLDSLATLYLNSFFARKYSMLPILMRRLGLCKPARVVLAPRGELSPGALKIKVLRKRAYIKAAQWFHLYDDLTWQASSGFESVDIRREFAGARRVHVAANMPCDSAAEPTSGPNVVMAMDIASPPKEANPRVQPVAKKPGFLRVVFLSRISRMKNLAGALRMLRPVTGDVHFDVYGPLEDPRYWEECEAIIRQLPPNVIARYRGLVEHHKVADVFARYDLFLFPTFGENYGHVIYEALQAGCPVLTSDQTPWTDLAAREAGWTLPLDDESRFSAAIQQCVDLDGAVQFARSTNARAYALAHSSDPKTLAAHARLFDSAMGRRT